MSNRHADLSITVTSYAAAADVDLSDPKVAGSFEPSEFFFVVETASVVAYSFDGVNDHGRLKGDAAPLYFTAQRISKAKRVWFKVVSGSNPATVRTDFWTHS